LISDPLSHFSSTLKSKHLIDPQDSLFWRHICLENTIIRAQSERPFDDMKIAQIREHNNFHGMTMFLFDDLDRIKAIQPWHHDIQEDNIGMKSFDFFDSLSAIKGGIDHKAIESKLDRIHFIESLIVLDNQNFECHEAKMELTIKGVLAVCIDRTRKNK
jgi:hypothetical protein